jgi:hypothetical protein
MSTRHLPIALVCIAVAACSSRTSSPPSSGGRAQTGSAPGQESSSGEQGGGHESGGEAGPEGATFACGGAWKCEMTMASRGRVETSIIFSTVSGCAFSDPETNEEIALAGDFRLTWKGEDVGFYEWEPAEQALMLTYDVGAGETTLSPCKKTKYTK